jgi:hypothetical protein
VKRFSLRTLFAVSSVIVLFLGFSQWRRGHIRSECEALQDLGVNLADANGRYQLSADNWFWPNAPDRAVIVFEVLQANKLRKRGVTYSVQEAQTHCYALDRRIRALGVKTIQIAVVRSLFLNDLDSLNSAVELSRYLDDRY